MDNNDNSNYCPKKRNYFMRKFIYIWHSKKYAFLYKAFLIFQHLVLWWITGYYGYRALAVGTALFGITAILSGIRVFIKIHMVILLTHVALLAFFLYTGMIDQAISEAKEMFTAALESTIELRDPEAIEYVRKIERAQKCCGLNSWKDYVDGVLDSCCTTPPCYEKDYHKLGCAEAFHKQRGYMLELTVETIIFILVLLYFVYVYFFSFSYLLAYLLSIKRTSKENKTQRKSSENSDSLHWVHQDSTWNLP